MDCALVCGPWHNTSRTTSFRVRKKPKGEIYFLAGPGPPRHHHTLLPSGPVCSMKQLTGEIGQKKKKTGQGAQPVRTECACIQPLRPEEPKPAMCVIIYASPRLLCSPYCDIQSTLVTCFCSPSRSWAAAQNRGLSWAALWPPYSHIETLILM